ncbi:MAG: type III-B CRISPR-associated protein Cas10/Cmr2, partial [Crocosphaera sp.]
EACGAIKVEFSWTHHKRHENDQRKPFEFPAKLPWGIPWIDEDDRRKKWPNPRLLNARWLIDDFPLDTNENSQTQKDEEGRLRNCINEYFNQGNNPTDWYVIATGDGDGMSKWLKGDKLGKYEDYMPTVEEISENESIDINIRNNFTNLSQQINKRMGPSSHNALSRALLDFSNRLVPYLTEERYAGRLIYSGGDDVLAYTNLWEWDNWLWDIRQCFKGEHDPIGVDELGVYNSERSEFDNSGNYWRWLSENENNSRPNTVPKRPLFTMGKNATLSFGVVIAHHSVPLAITLENLWEAEKKAKNYRHQEKEKDAVQVRVLFGNGNKLQATTQFDVFYQWKQLIELDLANPIEPSLFEQAAQLWEQHPAPFVEAIKPWTMAFCSRRQGLQRDDEEHFQNQLEKTLTAIYTNTTEPPDNEIKNWLKLAAFVLRNRYIKPRQGGEDE